MSLVITLPDGSKKEFNHALTIKEVASSIATSLAKSAVAGKVNDEIRPLDFVVDTDARVAIITDKTRKDYKY